MKLRMKRKAMVILAAGMLMSAAAPAAVGAGRRADCDSGASGRLRHGFGRFFVGVAGAELLVGEKAG